MEQLYGQPSDDEIADALVRSGYLMEARVASLLRDRGFKAETNTVVNDPGDKRERELDVVAQKSASLDGELRLKAQLVLECSNNRYPAVFLGEVSSKQAYPSGALTGHPSAIPNSALEGEKLPVVFMQDFLKLAEFHHHWVPPWFSNHCTLEDKRGGGDVGAGKPKWRATQMPTLLGSIHALCVGGDEVSSKFKDLNAYMGKVDLTLNYRILVLGGGLVLAKVGNGARPTIENAEYVSFVHSRLRDGDPANYRLDVVKESSLVGLLDRIDSELKETGKRLLENQKTLEAAVAYIRGIVRKQYGGK